VADRTSPDREASADRPRSGYRFDATIHAPKGSSLLDRVDELDIDRLPDPRGRIRALVTADELPRLLDMGFTVRLHRAHPVAPIDRQLVATDASVRRWLEARLVDVEHPPLPRGARPPKRGRRAGRARRGAPR